uniref:Uncharacterized protein n=1 Tax=Anguilla anguilla TaxID=7936 RepID=A0A0E9TQ18_ANGAN
MVRSGEAILREFDLDTWVNTTALSKKSATGSMAITESGP